MDYKEIKGYEAYSVSPLGLVVNTKTGRTLKFDLTKNGYHLVGLFKDGIRTRFYVHRLVATSFINNPKNKPYINHIDGNKTNNASSNLEWCTPKENGIHATSLTSHKNGKYKRVHNTQLLYTPTSAIETALLF